MPPESLSPAEVAHLGGGTLLVLNYAALIPGVLPTLFSLHSAGCLFRLLGPAIIRFQHATHSLSHTAQPLFGN